MEERIRSLLEENNLKELKNVINELNSSDLAYCIVDYSMNDLAKVFRLINKDKAVEVFADLDVTVASELLRYLSDKEVVNIIDEMSRDDAVDVL